MISHLYKTKSSNYFSGERKEMYSFIPNSCKRMLDIGCGNGAFAALVKDRMQSEVWGVDISPEAIELARNKLDKVYSGDFMVIADMLPDCYFDVITFNDSLEHFVDPISVLGFVKRKLAVNGKIICSLPNVRYFENIKHLLIDMDWQYEESGILDYTHLRFFTKKSMVCLFEKSGFNVESIIGIKPHYWSGKKIFILQLLFGKYVKDMKYLNYVITASVLESISKYN